MSGNFNVQIECFPSHRFKRGTVIHSINISVGLKTVKHCAPGNYILGCQCTGCKGHHLDSCCFFNTSPHRFHEVAYRLYSGEKGMHFPTFFYRNDFTFTTNVQFFLIYNNISDE